MRRVDSFSPPSAAAVAAAAADAAGVCRFQPESVIKRDDRSNREQTGDTTH